MYWALTEHDWALCFTVNLCCNNERNVTSKVRISYWVRSLDAAHLVLSPCKLEMEISIMSWMSSHWCSASSTASSPMLLPLSSMLWTIVPPLPGTLSIPRHWHSLYRKHWTEDGTIFLQMCQRRDAKHLRNTMLLLRHAWFPLNTLSCEFPLCVSTLRSYNFARSLTATVSCSRLRLEDACPPERSATMHYGRCGCIRVGCSC